MINVISLFSLVIDSELDYKSMVYFKDSIRFYDEFLRKVGILPNTSDGFGFYPLIKEDVESFILCFYYLMGNICFDSINYFTCFLEAKLLATGFI